MKSDASPATPLAPLILIVTLFFLWGVANNLNDVGPLRVRGAQRYALAASHDHGTMQSRRKQAGSCCYVCDQTRSQW